MKINALVIATFSFLFANALVAQDDGAKQSERKEKPQNNTQWPKLEAVFSDDFSTDTRSDYKIAGDVGWKQGSLTLNEGASIQRVIDDGGPWAKVELDVEWPELKKDRPEQELRIWFLLDGATPCFVRLRQESNGRKPTFSLALIETGEQDGKVVERPVREFAYAGELPQQCTIEYRHGLVNLMGDGKPILSAYIESGSATVAAVALQFGSQNIRLSRYAIAALSQREIALTAEEKQELAEAYRENERLVQLYRAGKASEASKICEQVLETRKRILGEEHSDYAQSLNNLATLYESMGEYARAEPLFVQARDIQKKVLGEEHPNYAQSLNNLAGLYQSMGEYARAEPLLVRARDIRKKVLGEEHPDFATSLNNLAELYKSIGEYARAEQLYTQACDIRKKALGTEHPHYAISLNNLADLYVSMGQYARAEPIYLQTINIKKKILGEEHPSYATSLNNLAKLYYLMGEYTRAEKLFLQILDIRKKVLGKHHPRYATSLNNMAALYVSMGKYTRAEQLYLQAKQIFEKALGEEHPQFVDSLGNLASLYKSMGEYARAEPLFLQARDIWKKVLGEEHPRYANSLNNLAWLYQSMGEYARAEPLYLQARDIQKKVLGELHPRYATSLSNLAMLYKSMGEFARAEPLYLQARDIRKKVLGEEHPDYATSLNNLAVLYAKIGEYAQAEPLYLQARDIRKKVLGELHPDYATSLNNLAMFYRSMGEYARAEPLYLHARDILKIALGEEHPEYALNSNNLAFLYDSMGEYAKAEPLYLQAIRIKKKILGEEHPDYATSLNNLAGHYERIGEYARAEPLFLQSIAVSSATAEKAVPSRSDAEAMQWVAENHPRTDFLFSILRRHDPVETIQPYQSIWKTKALATRLRSTQAIPNDAAPEVKKLAAELRDVRLRLAGLVTATPTPDQAKAYQQKLAEASAQKERLEKQLATVNPATKRVLSIRDAKVEDLLKVLPSKTAVVDLSVLWDWRPIEKKITLKQDGTEETRVVKDLEPTLVYDAFILRSDHDADRGALAKWVQLGEAQPINEAVTQWRSQLTGEQSRISEKSDPAATLRKLVWSKLEPHLEGCHTVIILPDGDLHKLPWAALPGREPGTYLIEDYAIATANYGQQLFGLLSDEAPQGNQLLVAGGIKYDQKPINENVQEIQVASRTLDVSKEDRSWDYLTGAENEAKEVLKLWQDRGQPISLSGIEANEDVISQQLEKARYAHLATHGFFDKAASIYRVDLRKQSLFETSLAGNQQGASVAARNPLLMTGIVLAGANLETQKDDLGLPRGKDGILTAEEIVGLNLRNLDLVTLSACETGLGDVAAGEGVFGLQRALHQAGARSVIASLWKVDDNATQALMVEFYKNLWEKKLSKVESLRQAQLAMIKRYDLKEGKLRGIDKVKNREVDSKYNGTPSFLWAAFQLSGDFR